MRDDVLLGDAERLRVALQGRVQEARRRKEQVGPEELIE